MEYKELTDRQKKVSWELLHDCLHYGSEEAIPMMFDQSKLIVLVNKLLNKNVLANIKCYCCDNDITNESKLCMKCAMTKFK